MSKKNKPFNNALDIKNPRADFIPVNNKTPRIDVTPNDHCRPNFRAAQMDIHGKWGWDKLDALQLQDLLEKIFNSQMLIWQQLREHNSHLVDTSSLIPEAQKRLKDLEKDDLDQLYPLRLSGLKRVWGIKEGNILWLLWWDPFHQVCRSHKKHT